MPQPVSWLTIIKTLPPPFPTWLSKSYLTQLSDRSCVLVVDKRTLPLINNLACLSKIYPTVADVYPDVTSLFLTSVSFTTLLKDEKVSVFTVEDLHVSY